MHRNSRLKKSNKMEQYADIYLLLNYCTCFGCTSRPSSGVHKTVVATSGADHTIWGTSFLKRDSLLLYAYIYLLLNYSTCFGPPSRPSSGVHKTVVSASGTDRTIWGASFLKRDQIRTDLGLYGPRSVLDLYQRLELQFCVLLMMGAMDARNMYSNLAVNTYLRNVASRWISST